MDAVSYCDKLAIVASFSRYALFNTYRYNNNNVVTAAESATKLRNIELDRVVVKTRLYQAPARKPCCVRSHLEWGAGSLAACLQMVWVSPVSGLFPGPGSFPARMLNAKVPAAAAWEASGHFQSRSVRMMCEVMPTISEDTALSQRGSQSSASDPDSHFEQLMVNMLDERDRLLDTLRETQESLVLAQQHAQDVVYDRDSLQRQLSSALPQVRAPLWGGVRGRPDGRS
ncbi:unnamed protein product [Arctogadus glacialis]